MKDWILYTIMLITIQLSAVSCISELDEEGTFVPEGEKYITLHFQTPGVITRATTEDNECESFMSHIDVVVYEYDNGNRSYTPFHHERINVSDTPSGRATLHKTKKDFKELVAYRFFVIANSKHESSAYYNRDGNILDYETFLKLDQTDEIIHLTGVDFDIKNPHYPQMFLMDGVAYLGDSEPATAGNIVINDPTTNDDVTIKVTLRRAAAKVQITINPGEKVTFTPELMALSQGYMVRNMPIRTTLAAEGGYPLNDGGARPYWKSTTISQTPYFHLSPQMDAAGNVVNHQIQVTLYCYSHTWTKDEAFERGTSVVLMLPLKYTENGKTVEYINNYYQLSFTKNETGVAGEESYHLIKRNTYYDLRVKLNAPGAEDFNEPEDVKDIQYFTAPWEKMDLSISGESGIKYLKVNKEKLYMYNVADDNTSLYFSSSSPVTVTLVPNSAYYNNKYNQKITLTNPDISGTTERGSVSGNISVHSDIPTNNTIRYFQLKVTNEEGLTEYVDVEQYPLIYITNFLPWYSYRDDYYYRTTGGHKWTGNVDKLTTAGDLPTTYRYGGDHIASVYQIESVNTTTREVKYTYSSASPSSSHGYTASKYRGDKVNNSEKYNIMYYSFSYNGGWWGAGGSWTMNTGTRCEQHNVRGYHVRVMASSNDYTIGRPALDEFGHTAGDAENAKLVSPSFVIASRLGAVLSTYSGLSNMSNDKKLVAFADHAKNYVEVDDVNDDKKDPVVVYDNWRLPTEAELKIIMDIQGTDGVNADAIDFLLNGGYYMSASGPVFNPKNSDGTTKLADPWQATGVAIRCVRDVFE